METIVYKELSDLIGEYGGFVDLFQASKILNLSYSEVIQLVKEEQFTTISTRIAKFQVATLFHFMYKTPMNMPIIQGSNAFSALQCDYQETDDHMREDWVFMAKLKYGEGSLYTSKGGNKYHVAFYYLNHELAKARKVLTANSEEEALEKMRVFKANFSQDSPVLNPVIPQIIPVNTEGVISFAQVHEEYMELWLAKNKAHNTIRDRQYCYNNLILPHFADMDIKKITATQVQLFYNKIKIHDNGTLRSHSVMKKARTSLNAIFDFAQKSQGYIDKLPTYKVELPDGKPTNKEERFFERQELVELFSDLFPHEKYFLVAKILMGTGLRSQEFLALQWSNIDFENKTIKITNAMIQSRDENQKDVQVLGNTKTKASVRTIYVGSVVIEALKQWKSLQDETGVTEKAKIVGTEDFVVLNKQGKVHLYHSFHNNYMSYIRRNGTFKHHANWYCFRHCFAMAIPHNACFQISIKIVLKKVINFSESWMDSAEFRGFFRMVFEESWEQGIVRCCPSYNRSQGVEPMVISKFMGHTGETLTERIYTSVPKEKLAEGAEIYNQFLVELFQDMYSFMAEQAEKKAQEQEIFLLSPTEEQETIETTEEITEEETNFEVIKQKVNLRKTVTKRTKCYKKK